MASKRNGSESNHSNGHNTSARRASGQQSTNNKHHAMTTSMTFTHASFAATLAYRPGYFGFHDYFTFLLLTNCDRLKRNADQSSSMAT